MCPVWDPSVQTGCWQTGVRITKMGGRLRHFMDKRDWSLFSLGKRKLRGKLIVSFDYLMRGYGEDGAKLLSELPSKMRTCNNYKVQQEKACMNKGNRLPRKAFGSPSLNIKLVQRCSWATCSDYSLAVRGTLDKMSSRVLFSLDYSILLLLEFLWGCVDSCNKTWRMIVRLYHLLSSNI